MRAKAIVELADVATLENSAHEAALPTLTTATALYASQVTPLRTLLVSLLWAGLTMLVARPKAGKSWLTLQAAIHVPG